MDDFFRLIPESIEWFTEDQDFTALRMIRLLAHPPSSSLLPSASCLSLSVFLGVAGRAFWREKGEGGGGAKLYDLEKAWPSINHSILSARSLLNFLFIKNKNFSERTWTEQIILGLDVCLCQTGHFLSCFDSFAAVCLHTILVKQAYQTTDVLWRGKGG